MLESLRKIFGRNPAPERATEPARQPHPQPPFQPPPERSSADMAVKAASNAVANEKEPSAFVCHEALLGRDQRIVGYEFGHSRQLQARMMDKHARIRRFYDEVLLQHLSSLQIDSLLGARLAFVEISPDSLAHPALSRLPKRNLALLLTFAEALEYSDPQIAANIVAALAVLRAQGVRVGLKWQREWGREWGRGQGRSRGGAGFLPWADFVQISWHEYAGGAAEHALTEEIARLRHRAVDAEGAQEAAQHNAAPLRLIAGGLQNPNDFSLCYRLGFDFFRGPFVNSRDQWTPQQSSINRLRVVQLLNGVRRDADTTRLVQELKQDPVLSYKLLRYINSPAIGLQREITTLDQAVTILGRENLYRWLSLLLFNMTDPGYREWALTEQALARAALMERLGREAKRSGQQAPVSDALFLTGLFSLLDQLLGEPLSMLTAKIQLPPEISMALVERRGVLAAFLALAEACEAEDPHAIAACAKPLGFSAAVVNHAVFDALAWAHEMTEISAS